MHGPEVSSVNVQSSPGDVIAKGPHASNQPNEINETITKLQAEMARQVDVINQLQADRAKQNQVIAALWDLAYPPEKIDEDLINYPSLEQCHSLADLLGDLRAFSQTIKEQHCK